MHAIMNFLQVLLSKSLLGDMGRMLKVIEHEFLFLISACCSDGCHRPTSRHSMLDCVQNTKGNTHNTNLACCCVIYMCIYIYSTLIATYCCTKSSTH